MTLEEFKKEIGYSNFYAEDDEEERKKQEEERKKKQEEQNSNTQDLARQKAQEVAQSQADKKSMENSPYTTKMYGQTQESERLSDDELKEWIDNLKPNVTKQTKKQEKDYSTFEAKGKYKTLLKHMDEYGTSISGVDEDYINKFRNDAESYFNDAETAYKSNDRESSQKNADDMRQKWNTLHDQYSDVLTYYHINKDKMNSSDYEEAMDYMKKFDESSRKTLKQFDDANSYYKQWDSEDDQSEELENKRRYDERVNSGWISGYGDDQYDDSKSVKTRQDVYRENAETISNLEKQIASGKGDTKALKKQKDAIEFEQRQYERTQGITDKYESLRDDKDFVKKSRKGKYNNTTFEESQMYVNKKDGVLYYNADGTVTDVYGNVVNSNDYDNTEPVVEDKLGLYMDTDPETKKLAYATPDNSEDVFSQVIKQGDESDWSELTNKEINTYYYLLNTKGSETASNYLDEMKVELNRRTTSKRAQIIDEADALQKVAMNVASVPASVFGGFFAAVDDAYNRLTDQETNPYDRAHDLLNYSREVRSETAKDINDKTGNVGLPVVGTTFGDVYQALMSSADSVVGANTLGRGYTVFMGMGAASSKARELYEQGASEDQITKGAILSGAAETFFEYVSVDKLLSEKTPKNKMDIIKNFLEQSVVEGSEEVNTEIANMLLDSWNLGSQSEFSKNADEMGAKQAFIEAAKNVANAYIGGAISGGASGASQSAMNYMGYKEGVANYGKDLVQNGGMQSYLDYGERNSGNMNSNTEALYNTAREVAKAKEEASVNTNESTDTNDTYSKEDYRSLGAYADNVNSDIIDESYKTEIKNYLEEQGMDSSDKMVNKVYNYMTSDSKINIASKEVRSVAKDLMRSNTFDTATRLRMKGSGVSAFENAAYGRKTPGVMSEQANKTHDSVVSAIENRVSDDNTSRNTETGEEVTISNVASIENGNMTFNLSDGTTVDSKNISYESQDQAMVYESAMQNGYSANTTNQIVAHLSSVDGDTGDYLKSVSTAYSYGKENYPYQQLLTEGNQQSLSEADKKWAYNLGVQDAKTSTASEVENLNALDSGTNAKGRVIFDSNLTYDSLPARQKASVSVLGNIVSNYTHNNVVIFESQRGEDGNLYIANDVGVMKKGSKAPNGFYDTKTGTVYIDANAGNNGEGVIAYTMAHEFTHFIRQNAPEQFDTLKEHLLKSYFEGGVDVETLVKNQMDKADKAGRTISKEEAMEEVVADSMESMFTDQNVGQKLAELKNADKSLYDKLKDFVKKLYNNLKAMYKGLDPQSTEGEYVKNFMVDVEKIADIFAEGLYEAGNTYEKIGNNYLSEEYAGIPAAEADITPDNKVMESTRTATEKLKKFVMPLGGGNIKIFDNGKTYTTMDIIERNAYRCNSDEIGKNKYNIVKIALDAMKDFMDTAAVEYNALGIEDVNNASIIYDEDTGRYIFSAMVKNGDYPVNFDFTTVCKKRDAAAFFIDRILTMKDENGKHLSQTYNLSDANLVELNNAMRESGYETACLGCFVEAKRYNIEKWANDIVSEWNAFVDKYESGAGLLIDDGKDVSVMELSSKDLESLNERMQTELKDENQDKKRKKYLAQLETKRINVDIAKQTLELRENNLKDKRKELEDIKATIRDATTHKQKEAVTKKIEAAESRVKRFEGYVETAKNTLSIKEGVLNNHLNKKTKESSLKPDEVADSVIKTNEKYRKKIKMSDIVTKEGIMHISENYPDLLRFIKTRYGTGTPKLVQGFTPYNSEIGLLQDYKGSGKNKQTLAEYLYSIGGIRLQSFSDFKVEFVFDYLQMFADAYMRDLPLHTYTKEISFAKLFGRTGAKINMSVMYNIMDAGYWSENMDVLNKLGEAETDAPKIARKYAGMYIDKSGNLAPLVADKEMADYFLDKYGVVMPQQSIAYKEAIELMHTEGYTGNVGTIGVGFSDYHVRQLLADPNIRYVIPYHRSSLPTEVNNMANLVYARDYTSTQNTLQFNALTENGEDISFDKWMKKNGFETVTVDNALDIVKEFNKQKNDGKIGCVTKKAAGSHGEFNLYTGEYGVQNTGDPKETVARYVEYCLNKGWLPLFYEFADDPNYYKVHFDFNVYDCNTEEYAPQEAVDFNLGDIDEFQDNVSKYMRIQNNYKEQQYTDERVNNTIDNWKNKVDARRTKFSGRDINSNEKKAAQMFGTTTNFEEAGYIISDGTMINFSSDNSGKRDYDHRAIGAVFGTNVDLNKNHGFNEESTDDLERFVEDGAIRIDTGDLDMDIGAGLQLSSSVPLTKEQEQTIRDFVRWKNEVSENYSPEDEYSFFNGSIPLTIEFGADAGYAVGDVSENNLNSWGVKYLRYEGNKVSPSKVIDDIRHFYQTGEIRKQSPYAAFFSDRDSNATDNRTILANALESTAKSDVEKKYIETYKGNIKKLNDQQKKLVELRREIKELSFGKGKRDKEKLKNLKEEATKTANRINIYDKKLLKLESMQPMKSVLDSQRKALTDKAKNEKRLAVKDALITEREKNVERVKKEREKYAERLKKERERSAEKVNQQKEKFKDYKTKRRETAIRNKVKKYVENFEKRLKSKNESNSHIPAPLVESVIGVYNLIDPTGKKEGTKVKKKYESTKEAFSDLLSNYVGLKDESYDFSSEYSDEFAKNIISLSDAVGNTPVRDMTGQQLEDVYKILHDISAMISDATVQLGKWERITNYQTGAEIIGDIDHVVKEGLRIKNKTLKKGIKLNIGDAEEFVMRWTLNPMRMVREMVAYNENATLYNLFKSLNEGRIKADKFRMDMEKKFEEMRSTPALDNVYNNAVEKSTVEVQDKSGKKVKISKMQAMQALLTWEREVANENRSHLVAPVRFTDVAYESKGKYDEAFRNGHDVYVDYKFVCNVQNGLTDWDRKYLDVARKFFNEDSKKAINDVSMITKHRPVATEKCYIPYAVNDEYVIRESDNLVYNASLESMGMLKSVKVNAKNQLVMRGLNVVVANHIDDVAKIHGLTIPVRNFNKAINVIQTMDDGGRSVRSVIDEAWGKKTTKVMEDAVADLQSPRRGNNNKLVSAIRSGMVTSTLAGNISVSMKQAASYPTAGAVLSTKSLIKGLQSYNASNKNKLYEEIDKYTPQHYMRRKGMSTQELGDLSQTHGWKTRIDKKLGRYAKASPMNWIQAIDVATTGALWEACKHEVGRSDYDQIVKLYNKVLEETQPMYDTLHRAELTKDQQLTNFIMFQTQPIQNSGILHEGTVKYIVTKKEYGSRSKEAKDALKQYRMAVQSQMASHFVFSLMTLMAAAAMHRIDPWRDENKELTPESILSELGIEVAQNFFGAVFPVAGNMALSAYERVFEGSTYDVLSDPALDKVNNSLNLMNKVVDDGDAEDYVNLACDIASYFGVPAKNILRLEQGLKYHIQDAMNGKPLSFEAGLDRSTGDNVMRAYSKYADGDTEGVKEAIEEAKEKKMSEGKTEKEAYTSIKSSISSKFKEDFLDAYRRKDNARMEEIRRFMSATGAYTDCVKTTQTWIKNMEKKEAEQKK